MPTWWYFPIARVPNPQATHYWDMACSEPGRMNDRPACMHTAWFAWAVFWHPRAPPAHYLRGQFPSPPPPSRQAIKVGDHCHSRWRLESWKRCGLYQSSPWLKSSTNSGDCHYYEFVGDFSVLYVYFFNFINYRLCSFIAFSGLKAIIKILFLLIIVTDRMAHKVRKQ